MATKTISLRIEAYERLRRAKRPGESFSDVVMRAEWPERAVTAREYLAHVRERGPAMGERNLDEIEALSAADAPPPEKWSEA